MSLFEKSVLLLLLTCAASAQAGVLPPPPSPTPSSDVKEHATSNDVTIPPMNYWGGPVVENAKIYAIFWGPSVDVNTQEKIGGFFRSIADSSYFDFMNNEYNTYFFDINKNVGTFQEIHHARFMGATTIFPKNTNLVIDDSASQYQISAEINYQISIGELPAYDRDTIYMIFLPPTVSMTAEYGTSCQQWCTMNGAVPQGGDRYLNYGVVPDQGTQTCGPCSNYYANGNAFDSVTYNTSWAIAAAVTDPQVAPEGTPNGGAFPESWIADDGETEIGTMCDYTLQKAQLKGSFGSYLVQPLWSRSKGACTNKDFISQ